MGIDVTKLNLSLNVRQQVLETSDLSIFEFDFLNVMIAVVTILLNYSTSGDVQKFIVILLSVLYDLLFSNVLLFDKFYILKCSV
jgi:hypothetical protein